MICIHETISSVRNRQTCIVLFILLTAFLPVCSMAETWPYLTPHEGVAPLTVQFVVPDPGAVKSALWEFGDKETSKQAQTSHTYTKATIYYPKLTLTIPGGDIVYEFDYIKALLSEKPGSVADEKWYPDDYTIYTESDEIDIFTSADYTARGDALTRLGFMEEAADAYDTAIGMDSGNAKAWKGYADSLYSLGSYANAASAYQKALDMGQGDGTTWTQYGQSLLATKQYSAAVETLKKAVGMSGSTASTWSGYGQALEAAGMQEEAVAAFKKATSLDSNNASAWLHYGKILESEGMYEEARDALEKSIAINGGSVSAWSSYANALSSLGLDEEASSARRKAGSMNTVRLPPRAPEPMYCSLG